MKRGLQSLKKLMIVFFILIPATSIAFLGIGDSSDAFLASILSEMISHTQTLRSLFTELNFLKNLQQDVREGVQDTFPLEVNGLPEREDIIKDLIQSAGGSEIPVFGRMGSINDLKASIESVWGSLPKTGKDLQQMAIKDFQAIYSLSQASQIQEEADHFYETGQNLLDDLDGSHEGKAIIRNAQASALQIKQLSQIEANQGLQISLQAQEILSRNEQQKGIRQFSDSYLDMLEDGFSRLKPMAPK
jgi:hypothetical protein